MEVLPDLSGCVDQKPSVELLYLVGRNIRFFHLVVVDRAPHVVLARRQHPNQIYVEGSPLSTALGSTVNPSFHQEREQRTGSRAKTERGKDR